MKFGAVITCRTIPGHVSAVFLQFPHFLMFPVPDFPTACRLWLSSGLLDRCATCAMVASYVLAYSIALSCVKSSPCSSMRSWALTCLVPMINYSIRRSSNSFWSLNLHLFAWFLHQVMKSSVLSSAFCFRCWSWYLANLKLILGARCFSNLDQIWHLFYHCHWPTWNCYRYLRLDGLSKLECMKIFVHRISLSRDQ